MPGGRVVLPTLDAAFLMLSPGLRSASALVRYLTQPVTPDTVRKNTAFTTYGYLEPLHSGYTPLYFYHYEGGRYKLYEHPNAKNAVYDENTTKYTLRYKLPYAGKWMVKARHSDSSHASTWSPVREFVVRR
jgi:hypothetical protein